MTTTTVDQRSTEPRLHTIGAVCERLRAEWSHYLVYPPRSDQHPGVQAFRTWLLAEAQRYREEEAAPARPERTSRRRRS